MKFSLVVAEGVHKGKVIPVPLSQFLIGRDPQCHLRPASAAISKRHCALIVRGGAIMVRDFKSTNGTFVNGQQVTDQLEVHDGDQLKVGPLLFSIKLEGPVPVSEPTPAPKPVAAKVAADDDESVAAMLLGLEDDGSPGALVGEDSIPGGSTVMEGVPGTVSSSDPNEKPAQTTANKPAAKPPTGNTSNAAKAILDKYLRRPRA